MSRSWFETESSEPSHFIENQFLAQEHQSWTVRITGSRHAVMIPSKLDREIINKTPFQPLPFWDLEINLDLVRHDMIYILILLHASLYVADEEL